MDKLKLFIQSTLSQLICFISILYIIYFLITDKFYIVKYEFLYLIFHVSILFISFHYMLHYWYQKEIYKIFVFMSIICGLLFVFSKIDILLILLGYEAFN